MKKTANEKGKIWLKQEIAPYNKAIFFLAILTVFSTLFSVAFAYIVRYLFSSASAGNKKGVFILSLVILGLLFLRIALRTWEHYSADKLCARITSNLRVKMFSRILHADYARLQNYHSGELTTRLTTDVQEVAGYSVSLLPAVTGMVVQCLGAVVALLFIDPLFTAIYIVAGCIFAGLTALFRKKLKIYQKEVLEADGAARSYMQENLTSVVTLKAYSVEEKSKKKAEVFMEKYYNKRMQRNVLRSVMSCIFSLLSNFGLIFAVIWSSVTILFSTPDYGSILSSILLLMQLQSPLASFSAVPPAYYARLTSGERLAEIDELAPEKTLAFAPVQYDALKKISLRNLEFSYGREVIFTEANAEIEKGQILCLTGPSGAGKSTIFKLLLNIFIPTKGEIVVEEENGNHLLTSLDRNLFAYVPQGNFLFSGTIYENLVFFAPEKESIHMSEKINTALKAACADFVFALPQGLDTILTERGEGLSEGQLQRLAVARALLSERPILLLDEATSALDTETERALLENIKRLQDKTCLIVTHRPAALAIADGILHVEDQKIEYTKKTEL